MERLLTRLLRAEGFRASALAAVLFLAFAGAAFGQAQFPTAAGGQMVMGTALMGVNGQSGPGGAIVAAVSPSNPLSVTCVSGCGSGAEGTGVVSGTGSVSGCTVGTSSGQCVASAAARVIVAIDNESASATVACNFGGTAVLNAAGSWTIPPGMTRSWSGNYVPAEAVDCIASAAATPVTIEAH